MTQIVAGNDFELAVALTKNKKPFVVDYTSTAKAALVSADHNQRLLGPVVLDLNAPGADLAQSLVIVKFSAAETAALARFTPAKIEIEITDPFGVKHPSWFVDVRIVKGQIG